MTAPPDPWDAALSVLSAALHAGRMRETAAAFRQAMADLGIPEHPGGRCPAPRCRCVPLEPLVVARAAGLLAVLAGGAS